MADDLQNPNAGPPLPELSVIVPFLNEEAILARLVERLAEALREVGCTWEAVFVDDGSTDAGVARLREAASGLPCFRLVRLRRNYGLQAAYRAGIDHACGRALVFLDADLQDPPEMIPGMLERWRQGADVVVGVRRSRRERGFRGLCLRLFHEMFHRCTDGLMPKHSGTFGLMDRAVAESVRALPERNLFLPAMRMWAGDRCETLEYDRCVRSGGEAKQSFARLFAYAWDGVTSFSDWPVRFIFIAGCVISLPSFCYAAGLLAVKGLQWLGWLRHLEVEGFTTIAVAVLCLGGAQLMSIGILGEYISRIYRETKGRPHYLLRLERGPRP